MVGIFEIKRIHLIVLAFSLTAFEMSVFCQVVLDKQPCELCLFSRYTHLVVAILSGLAIKYRSKISVQRLVSLALLASLGIGLYHLGAENHWWAAPKSCSTVLPTQEELASGDTSYLLKDNSPKCDEVNLTIFGISATLINFFLSSILFWFVSVGYALNYGRNSYINCSCGSK
ncbi:MAG: disulfide bond formation protein B [Holosporales bacterium]|jgi:disulfide bond formation protein DsbB|nr:disulfide bond formation protein B [Holosporales bacterium]